MKYIFTLLHIPTFPFIHLHMYLSARVYMRSLHKPYVYNSFFGLTAGDFFPLARHAQVESTL